MHNDQLEADLNARLREVEATNADLEERLARLESAIVLSAGALGALAASMHGVDAAEWPRLVGLA